MSDFKDEKLKRIAEKGGERFERDVLVDLIKDANGNQIKSQLGQQALNNIIESFVLLSQMFGGVNALRYLSTFVRITSEVYIEGTRIEELVKTQTKPAGSPNDNLN